MIFWRGWGILVIPIYFVGVVVGSGICTEITGDPAFFNDAKWPAFLTIILTSAAIFFTGRYFNRPIFYGNSATGQPMVQRGNHSLFFVKMEYWAIPVFAVGLWVTFGSLFS